MYLRWIGRKRGRPDIGPYGDCVRDTTGRANYDGPGAAIRNRRRTDGTEGLDIRWSAVVVESARIDGKPRQRHIAWLGSITESRMEVSTSAAIFGMRFTSASIGSQTV